MKKITTDLAIIAAGPAGIAAAITGAEKGLNVSVFEKSSVPGGTSNMGMGPFAVESRIQKEAMIGLTKEEAFKLMMDYTHWQVDARMVRDYFWKSADTIQWLEAMGVRFAGALKYYPEGHATWHVVQPADGSHPGPRCASTMMKLMYERALELGVTFYFDTPAVKLTRDGEDVVGLVAKSKDGEEYEVEAAAIVIATGGFGDNPEMIKEHCDFTFGKDMFNFRIPGLVGDGLRMAWEAGAGKGNMEMEMIMSTGHVHMLAGYVYTIAMQQPRSLIVNKEGKRVMDESVLQNTAVTANVSVRQSDRCLYVVSTDSHFDLYRKQGVDWVNGVIKADYTADAETWMQKAMQSFPGEAVLADTPEEAARLMGIDVETFMKTLAEYNESCALHYDDLFCKDRRFLTPLEGKKFYILRLVPGAYGTLGGIKVDSHYQVLTQEGKKLYGLYAAGSDVCDLYAGTYLYYLPGNTMGFALNSGRLAAEQAAEFINSLETVTP